MLVCERLEGKKVLRILNFFASQVSRMKECSVTGVKVSDKCAVCVLELSDLLQQKCCCRFLCWRENKSIWAYEKKVKVCVKKLEDEICPEQKRIYRHMSYSETREKKSDLLYMESVKIKE